MHLQQQKFARDDIVDAGLAFVNRANKLQDQFRGRLMFPIYDQRGDAGRLRRPRARRRRPEVQELARDADLPEEPVALRAQLGEGRDRRARRGRDLRGLHRRHGVRARRRRRTRSPRAAPRWPTTTSRSSRTSPARWCSPTTPTPPARARRRSGTAGSSGTRSSSRWPTCPPGRDPADVWRDDPAGARAARRARRRRSCSSASTGVLAAADLATLEGRARAGRGAAPRSSPQHPSELVRDQYVMKLAGELDIDADRLRDTVARHRKEQAASGARPPRRTRAVGRRADARRAAGARRPARARRAALGGARARAGRRLARRAALRRPARPRRVRRASRRATTSTTRSRRVDGAVRDLLERVAVEEPIGVGRARDVARAPDGEHRRTGRAARARRACSGRRRARHVAEVAARRARARARDRATGKPCSRTRCELLGWLGEGARGAGPA